MNLPANRLTLAAHGPRPSAEEMAGSADESATHPLLGGEGWGEGEPFSIKLRIFVVNEPSLHDQGTSRRSVAMGREEVGEWREAFMVGCGNPPDALPRPADS